MSLRHNHNEIDTLTILKVLKYKIQHKLAYLSKVFSFYNEQLLNFYQLYKITHINNFLISFFFCLKISKKFQPIFCLKLNILWILINFIPNFK